MRSILQTAAVTAGLIALAACNSSMTAAPSPPGAPGPGSVTTQQDAGMIVPSAAQLSGNYRRACPESMNPDVMACDVLIDTSVAPSHTRPDVSGWGAPDIESAYNLPSSTGGNGQTVAIVDAYDNATAETDLQTYRSYFGLPDCTTSNGCFQKLNQAGQPGPYPPPNSGWATEEALDIEMVSATCPNCHIMLIEANAASAENLGRAVDRAVKLGANVVSNSYGSYGGATRSKSQVHYDHKHHIITASSGDRGYLVQVPAAFNTVVSVGGTRLTRTGSGRGWTEDVWAGSGSGCAWKVPKPPWQTDSKCAGRTMNDVAAVASNVALFHGSSWGIVGGTSVSAPLIAGVYGLAGNAHDLKAAQSLYANTASLYDITTGSNGTCRKMYLCTAEPGYDGPTGNGTPNGVGAF